MTTDDDIGAGLAALKPQSKMGRLRLQQKTIERQIKAGVGVRAIAAELTAKGLPISEGVLSMYVHRLRRERDQA